MMEALVGLFFLPLVASECLSNATLNEQAAGGIPIPKPGSCCMNDVCGLACPLELSPVAHGKLLGFRKVSWLGEHTNAVLL